MAYTDLISTEHNVDSDDSSSSIPMGPPGGGPLIFLPVQQSTNPPPANDAANDSDSSSSSSSDSTPIGVPGGAFNDISFLPVIEKHLSQEELKEEEDNDGCASSSSSSSSSSSAIGVPGGGSNLNFLPVVNDAKKRRIPAASYSDDDAEESSPSPTMPRMSIAKTDIKKRSAKKRKKKKRKKKHHSNDDSKQFDNEDRWDLVYMTSSPLVVETESELLPLELLDVSRETEQIMNVLSGAGRSLCVVHCIATTGNLISAMTHRCPMLHYSGHGFPGYLAFEDETSIGDTHMLRDIAFKSMINCNKLEFVFTSACHSESVGLSFVAAGVPHVVAIDTAFEVSDEGAMTFTSYFYEALLCGRTIADSFFLAKQSVEFISSSAKRDFEKFKLLPDDVAGAHDVQFCFLKGELVNCTVATPQNNLPASISPFIGRSVEMREILHSFMAKKNANYRILNIFGDRGVGKSAIAIMCARYLADRKIYFVDGIFYVDCMALVDTCASFTAMMNATLNLSYCNMNDPFELICNLSAYRHALFILDDMDELISHYRNQLNEDVNQVVLSVIFKMCVQVSEKIKFIMISRKKLSGDMFSAFDLNSTISPRPYHLRRLSSTWSSKLFGTLCGGSWRPSDIKENIDIMSILKNNPFNIHELAKLKNEWECATLTKLVETYKFKNSLITKNKAMNNNQIYAREEVIKSHIANVSAQQVWRKAHGMQQCDYHKIFSILQADFTEYTFSKRKLCENNLIDAFRTLGMNHDLTINCDVFDAIYAWFNGATRLVQILSQYYNRTNPIVIHAWLSREEAFKLLSQPTVAPGTFLIRFRYKEAKSIAISYKMKNSKISNLKCDLNPNNLNTNLFICGNKLLSLPQFILSFSVLKYLYHDQMKLIPKNTVFFAENEEETKDREQDSAADQPKWNKQTKSWNPPPHSKQQQQIPSIKQYAPTQNVYHKKHHHHHHQY